MISKLATNINSDSSLLEKLISRGDEISIVQGKLIIKPNSGLPIPTSWLKQNRTLLINDICKLFNCIPLQYISYTTGNYGLKKSQGVTLQFINLRSRENAYIIFNANLKRSRKSKFGKKGDPLPNKQFIIGERSSFYKFWLSTGLPLPKSLSKFYECMSKLKTLTYTGCIDAKNRVVNKQLTLLEVSYQQILKAVIKPQLTEDLTAKRLLTQHQDTTNNPPSFTAKEIKIDHTYQGLAINQSACSPNHGNKYIRKEVISESTNTNIETLNRNNSNPSTYKPTTKKSDLKIKQPMNG